MASLEVHINYKRLRRQIAFCLFVLRVCQLINKLSFGLVDRLNMKYKFLEGFTCFIIGRKIIN